MKIVHTADWHIGKKLHRKELTEDFELFIQWLVTFIREEKVQLLLVSGDIFDLANPSSEARRQYYQSLINLRSLGCKIILTGGNHDSPKMLNAPKELLEALDITIIGGMPCSIEEAVIPVKIDEEKVIIGAIPYLREGDLRQINEGESYNDVLEGVQQGIEKTYKELAEYCNTLFPDIPIIAMGHLFAAGSQISESERNIQIGNQALFHASRFGEAFDYVALGHIHKPQRITSEIPVFYSGSPLPLSFSEREDRKRILLINTDNGFMPKSIPVPEFRRLMRISGTLECVQDSLNSLPQHDGLPCLLEIVMNEKHYNVEKISMLEETINRFDHKDYEIVHRRIHFIQDINEGGAYFEKTQSLDVLTPVDIFQKLIEDKEYTTETYDNLLQAFHILCEDLMQSETSKNRG